MRSLLLAVGLLGLATGTAAIELGPLEDFFNLPPIVWTTRGILIGKRVNATANDGIFPNLVEGRAFLGVPYATPPLGDLRFKKTVRLNSFPQNPYNATYNRAICPQAANAVPKNEDCLVFNIYTPKKFSLTGYPVLVYFHGGGLVEGNLEKINQEGALKQFVSRGIIAVTVQYRLGIPGFFTTNTPEFPAYRGFFDQIEALKFIRDEIRFFGGNPNKVTIGGYSAGAVSVHAHTLSNHSAGLFRHAISFSGTLDAVWEGSVGIGGFNQIVAQHFCSVNLNDVAALQTCLAAKTSDEFDSGLSVINITRPFTSIKTENDFGSFLYQRPSQLAINPNRPKIPYLIGTVEADAAAFTLRKLGDGSYQLSDFNEDLFTSLWQDFLPYVGNNPAALAIIRARYFPVGIQPTDHVDWLKGISRSFSGSQFAAGIRREILAQVARGNAHQTFVYKYTYNSPLTWLANFSDYHPSWHSSDLRLTGFERNLWNGQPSETDLRVAFFHGQLIANFVKTGRPGLGWTRGYYGNGNVPFFEVNTPETSGMRWNQDFFIEDHEVWNAPDGIIVPLNISIFPPNI